MELDDLLKFLIGAAYAIYWLVSRYRKMRASLEKRSSRTRPVRPRPPVVRAPTPTSVPRPTAPAPGQGSAAAVDRSAAERERLRKRLARLLDEARSLSEGARLERATQPMAVAVAEYLEPRARELLGRLERPHLALDDQHARELQLLEIVQAQLEVFVAQRRDRELRARLGDADALALSCYEPLIAFARAEGLPLSSNRPVTEIGGYELATWIGFIPTGIAPIFLPIDFFENVFWWPALAHEIAHDFFAATRGLSAALRRELDLPSEQVGTQGLVLRGEALDGADLARLSGGWFEELFCDVFATLMLGPAYGHAMVQLFAAPDDPDAIVTVARRAGAPGHYDVHPPRELRLRSCAHLLARMGQEDAAADILASWRYAQRGDEPEALFLPHGAGYIALPLAPFADELVWLVDRLYDEPFAALAGYRLRDIPGADFGPALESQAEAARRAFVSGRVPEVRQARAIIAGAVLAARVQPESATTILELACMAIAAEGTFEHAPDAYEPAFFGHVVSASPVEALRRAFILHTLLAPPPSARSIRPERGGFLARPRPMIRPRALSRSSLGPEP